MRGSNPRPLAHKTNTLPTELMEPGFLKQLIHSDSIAQEITSSVRGLVVMIVACQVMDPGSIPGERIFCSSSHPPRDLTRFCSHPALEPVVEVVFWFEVTARSQQQPLLQSTRL